MCCRLGDLRRAEDGGHRPHFFLPQGKPTCIVLVASGPLLLLLATFTPQVRREEGMELGARQERGRDRGPKAQFSSI